MAKVTGGKGFRKRLTKLQGRELVTEIGKEVLVTAGKIRAEAQFLIAKGSIQGKGHVPSAPGEPPNKEWGELTDGIAERRTGALSAVVESTADHASALEFGTSKMAERPYMRPAVAAVKPEFSVGVRRAVNKVIQKG